MSLAIINNNSVIYPTELYKKYNLYLIAEYEDFLSISIEKKRCVIYIQELKDLLDENTFTTNDKDWKTKILNVVSWEENLIYHYDRLKAFYRFIYKNRKVSSIESFSRKIKLEKLNSL